MENVTLINSNELEMIRKGGVIVVDITAPLQ